MAVSAPGHHPVTVSIRSKSKPWQFTMCACCGMVLLKNEATQKKWRKGCFPDE